MERVKVFLNSNELSINKSKTNIVEVMVSQNESQDWRTVSQQLTQSMTLKARTSQLSAQQYTRLLGANYSQNMSWD